jgi:hypothetical protein
VSAPSGGAPARHTNATHMLIAEFGTTGSPADEPAEAADLEDKVLIDETELRAPTTKILGESA